MLLHMIPKLHGKDAIKLNDFFITLVNYEIWKKDQQVHHITHLLEMCLERLKKLSAKFGAK